MAESSGGVAPGGVAFWTRPELPEKTSKDIAKILEIYGAVVRAVTPFLP